MVFNKLVAFAAAIAAVSSVGFASPTAVARTAPVTPEAANTNGNVFFCVDGGFTGNCLLFAITNNVCFNVPSGFNDDISSFGPDSGIGCTVFVDSNCSGASLHIENPGVAHLGEIPQFQDSISSFNCAQGA